MNMHCITVSDIIIFKTYILPYMKTYIYFYVKYQMLVVKYTYDIFIYYFHV